MDILIMQVFVSLFLGLGSVLLFLFTTRQRDFEHADRLALMPFGEDEDDKDHNDKQKSESEKGTDES